MRSVLSALALVLLACSGSSDSTDALTPDGSVAHPDASACGSCPSGYSCGTANGLPVCRNDHTGIPRFSHVFVIVMENTSFKTFDSASNKQYTPFLHSLMTSAAYGTDYHGITHPSLPNYVAMMAGDTFGIGCDCSPTGTTGCNGAICNAVLHACACPQQAANLADQLEPNHTWRAYAEDMGATTPCNKIDVNGYATRHVPFLYYDDIVTDDARCTAHVVDYGQLDADASANQVPEFVFIAPNLTDDMHDPFPAGSTNLTNGDTWLKDTGVASITKLDAYKNGGLLVIVWDEDDLSGTLSKDDPVPIFVMSPYAKTNYMSTIHADHYSLLATIEDGLGVTRLANAITAAPLSDYFPAQ
jgi:hypothetical protein